MSATRTVRLVAAVLPPADVVDELGALVGELKGRAGADRLRWTEPPGWHYTLAFYGEVEEDVAEELSRRLERAARRSEPFALAVRGGGEGG
uniref:2'-5' RNA ligase family protein n=1 Tax=Streptomyces scabiei TaxID=1930 RepID=UPI0023E0CBA9